MEADRQDASRKLQALKQIAGNRFVRDSIVIFAASMLLNVSNFGFHFLAVRRLHPAEYGQLAAFLGVQVIVSVPAIIAQLVVSKVTAQLKVGATDEALRTFVSRAMAWAAVAFLCVLGLMLVFAGAISAFLHVTMANVAALAAATAFSLFVPVPRAVIQGLQRYRRFAVSLSAEGLSKCGIAAVVLFVKPTVFALMLATATASAIGFVVVMSALPIAAAELRLKPLHGAGESFEGPGATTAAISFAALGSGDVIVAEHFLASSEAGAYAAIALAGKILLFFVSFISSVIVPKTASQYVRGERTLPVLLGGLAMVVPGAGTILVLCAVRPDLMLRLTSGAAYLVFSRYVLPYCTGAACLGTANVIMQYLVARQQQTFIVPVVAVLVVGFVVATRMKAQLGELVVLVASLDALVLLVAVLCLVISRHEVIRAQSV